MTDDDRAIRALFDAMCAAWTDGDAVAYGACFTPDCSYVSFDGVLASGRDAVVHSHDALFRGVLSGSALVGEVERVRFPAPGTALVHATGSVRVAWRSQLPKGRLTRNTLVAVPDAAAPHGWLFAAVQNTRVRPVRIPDPSSVPARAARALAGIAGRRS